MQLLPRLCVTCTTTTSTATADGERGNSKHITTVSSSSSTASSSSAAAGAAASDASSSTSLPSLPSLSATASTSGSFNTSLLHLTTLLPLSSSAAAAAVAAAPSHGLLVASPSSVSLHDLSTLTATSTAVTTTIAAGAVKCVTPLHAGGEAAAVTGHQDGKIRLWRFSARTGKLRLAASLPTVSDRLRSFPVPSNHVPVRRHHRRLWIEHADAVTAVAAAADGRLLFSASWDKTLKVWTLPSLRCVQSLPAHDDAVNAIAVAPDGTLYTGSADRRIRVWAARPASGKPRSHPSNKLIHYLVATLERHTAAVNALAVGCGGQVLYSGGNDRSIIVWEREDSASHMIAIGALRGHRKAVLCIACVDDNLVLSGSADRTVRIWQRAKDGRGYACIGVMDGHASAVRSITAVRMPMQMGTGGEEEYRVCSASFDGEVRVWSVRVSDFSRSDFS